MQLSLPVGVNTKKDVQQLAEAMQKSVSNDLVTAFWQANPDTQPDSNQVVAELAQLAESDLVANVTLASQPDDDFLNDLVDAMRQLVHPSLMFEVSLDPMIIGGMILRTPQHIYDWSVRKILVQTKPKLLEALVRAS